MFWWPLVGQAQLDAGPSDDASELAPDAGLAEASVAAEDASEPAADAGASEASAATEDASVSSDPGGPADASALESSRDGALAPDGSEAAVPALTPQSIDEVKPEGPEAARAEPLTETPAESIAPDVGVSFGPAAPSTEPVEVTVRGQLSAREQLQKSSDAVTVVNLRQGRKRSSDLGEVLSRVAGMSIRRYSGLGSDFRFSLNGLYDSQIRFFVDGVPIDRVYAMGLANLPMNLFQEVQIYRGVVPLRLAADALGGAVNLVTSATHETALEASYQVGSFGIHRGTFAGRYRHEPTGFVAGIDAFLDYADNDYQIDVKIPDERGRLSPARVRRFHDGYRAYGVAAELGVVDKPWARRLLARAFSSSYHKELQNNVVMSVPYGEPHYGQSILGGLITYQNTFARRYDLNVVASYSHRSIDFVDKGAWIYSWRGERMGARRVLGEIESNKPRDQTTWEHGTFGRATLDVRLVPGHMLTFTASPNYATRTGDESIQADPTARDPLTAERQLFKLVSGASYTLSMAPLARSPSNAEERGPEHYRVENVLFAKSYVYRADSEEPLPGNIFRKRDKEKNALGVGDTVRVTLVDDFLLAKASYEYATRLPETNEVFGNGVLILANLELTPETSQNANFGPQLDLHGTKAGDFWLDINAFLRDSRNLIVLLGNDRFFTHQNVYRARSVGIENSASWTSPGRYATLDAQVTYMDQRNVSKRGTFGDFEGDRIPNRPWLFASWGGFLRFDGVLWKKDRIEPFYQGRYVREFFRGWESLGLPESKATVPGQVSHSIGATYAVNVRRGTVYGTFDVQNISDAKLFDSFGVQRPGRGYYFKLVGEL
jgi:outer membrane cobalamin receptor